MTTPDIDGADGHDPGFTNPFMSVDPGPTQHHLDQGPEHLRSTPNVHEQDEVEDPEAEAVGAGRSARDIIVRHLAHCATDSKALPAVELACEVRRQLLGDIGQEGCPGWALKLFVMGGPAATHQLPHEMGQALQELASVFAEAMQVAVDQVRGDAAQAMDDCRKDTVTPLLDRPAAPFCVGRKVVTLSGEVGEVVNLRPYADGANGAVVQFSDPRTSEGTTINYNPTGVPESLAHDPNIFSDLFPLVIAYVKES